MMNKSILPQIFILIGLAILLPIIIDAQCTTGNIGGQAFLDLPMNGNVLSPYGSQQPNEIGVSDIEVLITQADGQQITTFTNNNGQWFANANAFPIRVEFRWDKNVIPLEESFEGTAHRTSVQFISAPDCNIDFALHDPECYSSTTDPIMVTGFLRQNINSATEDGLIEMNYRINGRTTEHTGIAPYNAIGTVHGVAVDKVNRDFYVSAFVKRHAAMGPLGIGGIYKVDYAPDNTSTLSPFVDVSTIGINVGTIDDNVTRGVMTNNANRDATTYNKVGTTGIGDMDFHQVRGELWLVNLFEKRLHAIVVDSDNDPNTAPTSTDVRSYNIPDPGCVGGEYRPFGTAIKNDKVYVGVVCDASTSQDPTNLHAYVYEFDIASNTFTSIFDFPLDYTKGLSFSGLPAKADWQPWLFDVLPPASEGQIRNGGAVIWHSDPQPTLSDIDFDVDGSLLLGLRDMFGDRLGVLNLGPDPADNTLYVAVTGGDFLRAQKDATGYTLESNGSSGNLTGAGVGNNEGPGGGEFFEDFSPAGNPTFHRELSQGSSAILKGSNEVVVSSMNANHDNPNLAISAGGFAFKNTTNGDHARGYDVYDFTSSNTFNKANGVGDIELLTDPAPLQIGNRVFLDQDSGNTTYDNNGTQDPNEINVPNVTVTLTVVADGNTYTATTTTDANGEYYFTDNTEGISIANGWPPAPWDPTRAIIPRNALANISVPAEITIGTNDYVFSGGTANGNDFIDSDGIVSDSIVIDNFTTGLDGENDFTHDFGYVDAIACDLMVSLLGTACVDNNTGMDPADDFINFTLEPSGQGLGSSYSIGVINGSTTISPTTASYDTPTAFNLGAGSADGVTIYQLEVIDNADNACRDTITVGPIDPCSPPCAIECPSDMVLYDCQSNAPTNETGMAGPLNDSALEQITFRDSVVSSACSETIYREWSGSGSCGTAQSCTQEIVILDTVPPSFTVSDSSWSANCQNNEPTSIPNFSINDPCGSYSLDTLRQITPGACPSNYTETVTIRLEDECGRTNQVQFVIQVEDNTAPNVSQQEWETRIIDETQCELTSYEDIQTFTQETGVMVTDLCGSEITMQMTERLLPDNADCIDGDTRERYVQRQYIFTDECGNSTDTIRENITFATPCQQLTSPGAIDIGGETKFYLPEGCTPPAIDEAQSAVGNCGPVDHMWMMSIEERLPGVPFIPTESNIGTIWHIIPEANGATYMPAAITQNTYYVRCTRNFTCCSFQETNIIAYLIDNTQNCPQNSAEYSVEDCENDIILMQPDSLQHNTIQGYHTNQSIYMDVIIPAHKEIKLNGRLGTSLYSGFEVKTNTLMTIETRGCD